PRCRSVLHPFLSRVVPPRSVANSVARSHFVPTAVLAGGCASFRVCYPRSRAGDTHPLGHSFLKSGHPHTPGPQILPGNNSVDGFALPAPSLGHFAKESNELGQRVRLMFCSRDESGLHVLT